ncbi:MAG: hypothetical protein ACE5H4_15130 [Candidatus Thorarchaeota archaeon]
MAKENNTPSWPVLLALGEGLLYLTVGLIWLLSSIGVAILDMGTPDPIAALVMMIVSVTLLAGTRPLRRNEKEGYAFLIVGLFLAGILFLLEVIIISTNLLGWILHLDGWTEWQLSSSLVPPVWLFLITIGVLGVLRVTGKTEGMWSLLPPGV